MIGFNNKSQFLNFDVCNAFILKIDIKNFFDEGFPFFATDFKET